MYDSFPARGKIELLSNFVEGEGWNESRNKEYPTILRISLSPRADEYLARLPRVIAGLVHLRRESMP
jgi:hypothetical protein